MSHAEVEQARILLVEDDPAQARLFREALAESSGDGCELTVAANGAEALDILFQRGKYNEFRTPDVVLLDLTLPILSGHEVLNAIRAYHPFVVLPVIVLSASRDPDDIRKCYALGASCYIVKPTVLDELTAMCQSLHRFWFHRVSLAGVRLRAKGA